MSSLIAALRAALSLDTVQFESGAKKARRTANTTAASINKSLGSIKSFGAGFFGAFTVGALSAGVKAALNYAGSLGEVSQQLGVTTRDLQVLRYAAGQVGVSQEQLETGLSKLTITLGKVAAGAKAPTAALKAIGVSVDELKGKDTGEAFRIIADALAKIPDRAQRAAVEVALFGKAGANLDNVLSGGSAAINQLAQAAEELGIVLSDEQIQRADDTADKLEAVKTVLAANIAGVVADNASSIVTLASSLGKLTSEIINFLNSNPAAALGIIGALAGSRVGGLPGAAIGGVAGLGFGLAKFGPGEAAPDKDFLKKRFIQEAKVLKDMRAAGQPFGDQQAKVKRLRDKFVSAGGFIPGLNPSSASGTNSVGNFLAGGGGGGGKSKKDNSAAEAERARKEALRDAYDFAQDQRMADLDIIRAKQDLAVNLDDQTQLALEALDIEYEGQVARIQLNKDLGDISDAQAEILIAKEDTLKATREEAILADRAAQQRDDEDRMLETQFNIKRNELAALFNLAQTANERKRIALLLLELDYAEKRLALQRIVENEKLNKAVRDRAQAELDALNKQQPLDAANVSQGNLSPMAAYMASLPTTAEKWGEAVEGVAVKGFQTLEDSIIDVINGVQSLGDAFKNLAKQVINDLLRISIQRAIIAPLAGALFPQAAGAAGVPGGLPGFATGGSFTIGGRGGMDRNVMSINGLPVANVSRGERVSIAKGGASGGGMNMTLNFSGPVSKETMMQAGARVRSAVASANRKGA